MKPRIYTYKITFPSQGWWYWGVHKEKRYGEKYWGSPRAHVEKWKWFKFEKQILEFFDSYEEARKVEIRLILPDLNNPMCLNEGCGGVFSRRPISKSTRQKISRANKGRKHSEESRRRFSEAHVGARLSEGHKRKIGEALRGKKKPVRSEEHRRKLGEASRGRKFGEETRRKSREARKGQKWFYDPVSGTATRCLPENCPNGYFPGRKIK